MSEAVTPLAELLRRDRRYKFEAYAFVFEALRYGQETLQLGAVRSEGEETGQRHLSGAELCEAVRHLAIEQFGYMAKCVLDTWGIRSTGDVGEIVFNLIAIGEMRKTDDDRREDFDDVYDFETAFRQNFQIKSVSASGESE
jgi:uncharacterized repeat protein (TIGR04138 family)